MRPFRFVSTKLSKRSVRQLTFARAINTSLPEGFDFYTRFFDEREQRLLLAVALSQLDAIENIRVRRRQKDYRSSNPISDNAPVTNSFLPDDYYTFHVVSSWSLNHLKVLHPCPLAFLKGSLRQCHSELSRNVPLLLARIRGSRPDPSIGPPACSVPFREYTDSPVTPGFEWGNPTSY